MNTYIVARPVCDGFLCTEVHPGGMHQFQRCETCGALLRDILDDVILHDNWHASLERS